MRLRSLFLILVLSTLYSCDKITGFQKQEIPVLDTIVDFSSVDTSPSFSDCDSIIEKEPKTRCFRNTIHKSIAKQLQEYTFELDTVIDEEINVFIKIDAKGMPILVQMETSNAVTVQLPQLDSLLRTAIENLPKMYPAIKRGIPVETQYQLPIKIQLE